MADVYKKVGRGGAGNFYSKKDAADVATNKVRVNEAIATTSTVLQSLQLQILMVIIQSDLESQTQPTLTADLTRAISASKPPPEYLHTGRGGAGNWVQPSELTAQGLAQVGPPDATSEASATSPSSASNAKIGVSQRVLGGAKPTYRGGRGGAGNYTDFAEEERLKKEEEERVRRETEDRITRDVEAGLARPPRAYGGAGGAWEMGEME